MTHRRNGLGRLIVLAVVGALVTTLPHPSLTVAQDDAELTVAVAANFTRAMKEITRRFEETSGHTVTPVFASTGSLYAQITYGDTFDAFFAADVERPRRLEQDGAIVGGSRFTYAIGQLILWSADEGIVDPAGDVLETGDFRRIAIANPKLAPYGEAARQVMIERGVWEELQPKIVFGQNVNQVHQFITSGNAELGFLALSQVIDPATGEIDGSHWLPPQGMYDPVEQQAVILRRTDHRELAEAFMAFVQGEQGAEIIEHFGYAVPEADPPASD